MASKVFFVFGLFLILCSVDFGATEDTANDEDKMGMDVLYEMVHFFLGDIVQTKNITDSFLNLSTVFVNDEFDNEQLEDWEKWADYVKGYAAGVVIGLLFIIIMPIVGLVFCCCRLCGKCGGKPRKHDTRRSKCKRRTYCTLIIVFNTLALAGVICAFMCSHLIHKALKNDNNEGTLGHIRESLTSIKNFTDQAVTNVSSTVWTVFDKTAHEAITNINKTSSKAVDNVLESLNATRHLDKARDISKDVNKTKELLDDISQSLENMANKSKQLKNELISIGNDIKDVCNGGGVTCNDFHQSKYDTDADFSSLDSLQDQAKNVSKSMDMSTYITQAEGDIEKAKDKTRNSIQGNLDEATESIDDMREKVKEGLDDLTKQKNDAMDFYPSTVQDLKDLDEDVKDRSDTIFYSCIGVSCVYLLIVALYYFGVVFGLCGERPGHDAPCCNRGTGASFLMAGVALTFIFSWILMLLCTILFITGGLSYTEVCRYFHGHDPNNFKFFDDTLNNGFDLSKTLYDDPTIKFSLSQSLRDCQANKAMYSAFNMDHIVNLDDTINTKPLQDKLKDLQTTNLNIENITMISPALEKKLRDFADAGVKDINFDKYYRELNKSLTKVAVSELYDAVSVLAEKATAPQSVTLSKQAGRLKTLQDESVPALERDKDRLREKLKELQKGSDISEPINTLIADLKKSEEKFNTNKDDLVRMQIDELADLIMGQTNASVDGLKSMVRTDIAGCQPLSDNIYSVSDSVCVLLIDPLNGLWFSFGWCLFFFILCLIFGVLLAGEYRHEYKYGKEFDDPFDSRNHDMMPLTSQPNMDGRHHHPDQDHVGYQQQQQHAYQQPTGLHNSGYSPDVKHRHSNAPPPYRQHMQPGISAYASSPPPEYNGHRHHDLASAYPALDRDRNRYMGGGDKNSYSYPY